MMPTQPFSVQLFWATDSQNELPKTGKHFLAIPGVNQIFKQDDVLFNPKLYTKDQLTHVSDSTVFPLIISMNTLDARDTDKVTQLLTFATLNRTDDSSSWELKVLHQKLSCLNETFIIHDIFGMEQSNSDDTCVICLSLQRDTLIIPCRHFCVCHQCAQELRRQTNKCPICRGCARAMVKIPPTSESRLIDSESIEITEEATSGEEAKESLLIKKKKKEEPTVIAEDSSL